jgi:hypothetical protein
MEEEVPPPLREKRKNADDSDYKAAKKLARSFRGLSVQPDSSDEHQSEGHTPDAQMELDTETADTAMFSPLHPAQYSAPIYTHRLIPKKRQVHTAYSMMDDGVDSSTTSEDEDTEEFFVVSNKIQYAELLPNKILKHILSSQVNGKEMILYKAPPMYPSSSDEFDYHGYAASDVIDARRLLGVDGLPLIYELPDDELTSEGNCSSAETEYTSMDL